MSVKPDTQYKNVAEFLTKGAIGSHARLTSEKSNSYHCEYKWPDDTLRAYCRHEDCRQVTIHEAVSFPDINEKGQSVTSITYRCRHCKSGEYTFAILHSNIGWFEDGDERDFVAVKLGQVPLYCNVLDPKLESLFPNDPELSKGFECEMKGFGMAAFAYYRRIVERGRDSLFDQIIESMILEETDATSLEEMKKARSSHQFKDSLVKAKPYLPKRLFISNHNPLQILHTTLSKGVHDYSDEKCLEIAEHVRVLLTALAVRFEEIKSDHRVNKRSISALTAEQGNKDREKYLAN